MIPKIFNFNDYERDLYIAGIAASLPPGTRVLDAGAGPCRHRPLFAHCDYKAQDFAGAPDTPYGKLDFVGDITAIAAPDGAFDFILCSEVFEHIPRPDLALVELARLLRPGGELLLTAPLGSGIHMPPYHFYGGMTPYWYEYFAPRSGLSLISVLPNGGFFKWYGQESRRFLTMLTPEKPMWRALFMPIKLLLAIPLRVVIPLLCHVLDPIDKKREFTVGYFVRARKNQSDGSRVAA